MNTRWGRAGWGRTPATLRRHQASPSFMHRHDTDANTERPDIHFVSGSLDETMTLPERETETWLESPPENTDEN